MFFNKGFFLFFGILSIAWLSFVLVSHGQAGGGRKHSDDFRQRHGYGESFVKEDSSPTISPRLETLEERVARLKKELAEAEAQLAATQNVSVQSMSKVEIPAEALVVVSSDVSQGSGFIGTIRGKTFFITNIHVLAAARSAQYKNLYGKTVELSQVAFVSKTRDIAIVPIKWDGPTLTVSASLSFDEVDIGQRVTVMGNSDGARVATRLEGEITGMGPEEIEVSAKFVPGNSGSPIVHDELGTVIGVAAYMKDLSAKTKWTQDSELADIRRFAFRLDGENEWEQIALNQLYTQGESFQRFEDRTTVFHHIAYMLNYKSQLMVQYGSHENLGYLFDDIDDDFSWGRGTSSSHNQELLRRFVKGMLSELQTDRGETEEVLTVGFFKRRYEHLEKTRDTVERELLRFEHTRL